MADFTQILLPAIYLQYYSLYRNSPEFKGISHTKWEDFKTMVALTVSFEEAEKATGVSRFTLRKFAKTGRLKIVRVARRVVIPISELEKMFSPGAVSSLKSCESHPKSSVE
jgi:hypothetical protein